MFVSPALCLVYSSVVCVRWRAKSPTKPSLTVCHPTNATQTEVCSRGCLTRVPHATVVDQTRSEELSRSAQRSQQSVSRHAPEALRTAARKRANTRKCAPSSCTATMHFWLIVLAVPAQLTGPGAVLLGFLPEPPSLHAVLLHDLFATKRAFLALQAQRGIHCRPPTLPTTYFRHSQYISAASI